MRKSERLWQQGEAYLANRQWARAAEAFQSIAEHDPSHVPALLHWAGAVRQLGRYRLAAELVLRASRLPVSQPAVVLELVRRLRELSEGQPIFDVLARSGFIANAPPPFLADVAMRLATLGAHELALTFADRAITVGGPDARAFYLRASILMYFGRNDEAREALEDAIALAPAYAQAYWLRSRLRKATADDNAIAALEALCSRRQPTKLDDAYLLYALHNECHDVGDVERSWTALAEACAVKRSTLTYDGCEFSRLVEDIRQTGFPASPDGVPDRRPFRPLFIVGMYRSGTTLLERVLGGHTAIADGGESYIFTAQMRRIIDYGCRGVVDREAVRRMQHLDAEGYGRLGEGYLGSSAWRASGCAALTEKLPSNLLNAGFIAAALPDARILHSSRNALDTCFSNLRTFFTDAAPYSYDQIELADAFADSQLLAKHWAGTLGNQWLDVSYEDLTQQPEATSTRVFDFLDLPYEQEVLNVAGRSGSVATASAVDVRRGILRDRGGAWKPYERFLGPLISRLGERGVL
jgi:hypothetical protein